MENAKAAQKSARATKKQYELLTFIDAFIRENKYGPSYREVMNALGYKSVSTVAIHIDGLIASGYLRKKDNSARSIEVLKRYDVAKSEPSAWAAAGHEQWLVEVVKGKIASGELGERQVKALQDTLEILGVSTAK